MQYDYGYRANVFGDQENHTHVIGSHYDNKHMVPVVHIMKKKKMQSSRLLYYYTYFYIYFKIYFEFKRSPRCFGY